MNRQSLPRIPPRSPLMTRGDAPAHPHLWKLPRRRRRRARRAAAVGRTHAPQSGLSLLEVLIAAALILTVAVGILPIFISASANNMIGREASAVARIAGEDLETIYPMPFHAAPLGVASGTTETTITEAWVPTNLAAGEGDWVPESDSYAATPLWTRTRTVRQYSLSDLHDNKMLNSPLDGSAPEAFVHIKEVELEIISTRGRDVAAGKNARTLTVRFYKTF